MEHGSGDKGKKEIAGSSLIKREQPRGYKYRKRRKSGRVIERMCG